MIDKKHCCEYCAEEFNKDKSIQTDILKVKNKSTQSNYILLYRYYITNKNGIIKYDYLDKDYIMKQGHEIGINLASKKSLYKLRREMIQHYLNLQEKYKDDDIITVSVNIDNVKQCIERSKIRDKKKSVKI